MNELNVFQKSVLSAIDKTANQGQQSAGNAGSACAYRSVSTGGEPICCIIGHMITDDNYHPVLSTMSVRAKSIQNAVGDSLVDYELTSSDIDTLRVLQHTHDSNDFKGEDYKFCFYHALVSSYYDVRTYMVRVEEDARGGEKLPDYILNHCSSKLAVIKKEQELDYAIRNKMMHGLAWYISAKGWTKTDAAQHLGVTTLKIRDLLDGKISVFPKELLEEINNKALNFIFNS